jgi:hypothetical protein
VKLEAPQLFNLTEKWIFMIFFELLIFIAHYSTMAVFTTAKNKHEVVFGCCATQSQDWLQAGLPDGMYIFKPKIPCNGTSWYIL